MQSVDCLTINAPTACPSCGFPIRLRRLPDTGVQTGHSIDESLASLAADADEIFKRVYLRPEYQEVIRQYGPILLEALERDPEALHAYQSLLARYGVPLEQQVERALPLVAIGVGASFLAGVALGYFAEK